MQILGSTYLILEKVQKSKNVTSLQNLVEQMSVTYLRKTRGLRGKYGYMGIIGTGIKHSFLPRAPFGLGGLCSRII
jgi:hypothetical protein